MVKLKKITSSTMIESLVAMVIITISFTIALMISSNLARTNNPRLRIKAYSEVQKLYSETKAKELYIDEVFEQEGLTIERLILPYTETRTLKILEISAYDNRGKLLVRKRELVTIHL
jgi:hypothetical protein